MPPGQRVRIVAPSPLVLALFVGGVVQLTWLVATTNPPVVDFPIFYATTKAMLEHAAVAYPGFPAWPGGPVIYALNPPHFYLAIAPLTLLPLDVARAVWRLGILACLGAAAAGSGVPLRWRWIAAFVWCGGATTLLLITGQVGGLLALGIAAVTLGSPAGAGVALGALVTFKPFLALVLALWIWERRWRALGWAAVGASTAVAIGVIWVGLQPYAEWIAILRAHPIEVNELNASWPGFVARVFGGARIILWAGIAAIAVPTAAAVRRTASAEDRLLIVLLTSILLSPVGWAHYLWMTMVPLLRWLDRGGAWPAGAWLLWIPPHVAELGNAILPPWLVASACFYGLSAVWWATMSEGHRGAPRTEISFR
jgi:arabinofuranan 3-O-arabinosyltransferase